MTDTAWQVRLVRGELEDQERSLKAAVAGQEKKAHENWVAARQAERKLAELQVPLPHKMIVPATEAKIIFFLTDWCG